MCLLSCVPSFAVAAVTISGHVNSSAAGARSEKPVPFLVRSHVNMAWIIVQPSRDENESLTGRQRWQAQNQGECEVQSNLVQEYH